jgi:hypothetical protein
MRRSFSLLLLLVLPVAAACAGGAPETGPLDLKRDPRLTQKVKLEYRAIPVSWVLKSLSEQTGVTMRAIGRAGDERLVAFAPETPLAEVMEHIADLYRLQWNRDGKSDPPRYRLEKSPRTAREEQSLREKAIAQVLQRLSGRLRGEGPPAGAKTRPETWAPLYPEVLPLLATRGGLLTRDGFLRLPIGRLPQGERDRVLFKLTPLLKEEDARRSFALNQFREDEIARGIPPDQATMDKPPSDPLRTTLSADLHLAQSLQVSVGLRTDGETWYYWFHAEADDLEEPARALYEGRSIRRPQTPGGAEVPVDPADPLTKPIELNRDESARAGDWIGALQRLSEASGVALYTDCYSNYLEGAAGHPRAKLPAAGRGSVVQVLDTLCFPSAPQGRWHSRPNGFWWRKNNAALVRSGRWIWESETVVPAALLERAVAGARKGGGLTPEALQDLAGLTFFQLQQGDSITRRLDDWQRAVRIPAQLGPAAKQALFTAGLEGARLPAPDQLALTRLLPGEDVLAFKARLRTEVQDHPAQGGTVLAVHFFATPMKGANPYYLPLPGINATPNRTPN